MSARLVKVKIFALEHENYFFIDKNEVKKQIVTITIIDMLMIEEAPRKTLGKTKK